MNIHRRLLALVRDPEIPGWCRWAILGGLAIPGPVDELVIYPAVVGFVWLRRRHVLRRHGFGGVHALAGLSTAVLVASGLGLGVHVLVGLL